MMEHVGMVVIQGGYGHVRLKEGIVNMVQILNIAPQISPIHVLEPVGMDVVLEAFGLVLLKEDIVNIKLSKTFLFIQLTKTQICGKLTSTLKSVH